MEMDPITKALFDQIFNVSVDVEGLDRAFIYVHNDGTKVFMRHDGDTIELANGTTFNPDEPSSQEQMMVAANVMRPAKISFVQHQAITFHINGYSDAASIVNLGIFDQRFADAMVAINTNTRTVESVVEELFYPEDMLTELMNYTRNQLAPWNDAEDAYIMQMSVTMPDGTVHTIEQRFDAQWKDVGLTVTNSQDHHDNPVYTTNDILSAVQYAILPEQIKHIGQWFVERQMSPYNHAELLKQFVPPNIVDMMMADASMEEIQSAVDTMILDTFSLPSVPNPLASVEDKVSQLEGAISDLEEELASLRSQADADSETIAGHLSLISILNRNISNLQAAASVMASEHSAEVSELEAQVQAKQAELAIANQAKASIESQRLSENQQFTARIETLETEAETMQMSLSSANNLAAQLQATIDNGDQAVAAINNAAQALLMRLDGLLAKARSLSSK